MHRFQKTNKEKEVILTKVQQHHQFICEKYPEDKIIFTVLIGSQNYDLDNENSDIDTITWMLPAIQKFMSSVALTSHSYDLEDGHAEVKDIRYFFRGLQRTSPSSVEWVYSHYMIIEPEWKDIIEQIQEDKYLVSSCNIENMLHAIGATVKQLHGRNMSIGKKFSHALRLDDMFHHYLHGDRNIDMLSLRPGDMPLAYDAKNGKAFMTDEYMATETEAIGNSLAIHAQNYHLDTIDLERMKLGNWHLECFQKMILYRYHG